MKIFNIYLVFYSIDYLYLNFIVFKYAGKQHNLYNTI